MIWQFKIMSKTNKFNFLLSAGIAMVFMAIVSCHNGGKQQNNMVTQKLEVKTFSDTAIFSKNPLESEFGLHCELETEVDLPIDGPKPLTDSIRRLVTKEMYRMFDLEAGFVNSEDELHIPFEKVCKWDGENIFSDFVNHYRPLYEKYAMGAGDNSLTMKLVSQTETFVTYYEEKTGCAASCNTEHEYYTFRINDGYLLDEIISDMSMEKFVEKYPQYEIDENVETPFMGLSDKGLLYGAYVATGASSGENHIDTIPYKIVMPYLTEEVHELVQE